MRFSQRDIQAAGGPGTHGEHGAGADGSPGQRDWPGSTLADAELDELYNVQKTVGDERFHALLAAYRRASEQAVDGLPGHRGLVYDEAGGERLDIWGPGPSGASGATGATANAALRPRLRPVFVFLHGGYWRALSRHDSAFMARMLHENGVATVVPDYTLAPGASLEEIVRQVRAALAWIHRNGREYGLDPDRIVVGGSSAGGHLTGMVMVDGWQSELGLPRDVVKAAMPISGLFDLRPLTRVYVNEWLGLDVARAAKVSPLLLPAGRRLPALVTVAEHDGSGFLEQSARFAALWSEPPGGAEPEPKPEREPEPATAAAAKEAAARAAAGAEGSGPLVIPGRNHYDVILDLADQESALSRALLTLIRSTDRAEDRAEDRSTDRTQDPSSDPDPADLSGHTRGRPSAG